MEIYKQVTKDTDVVNIASFQNLNFEFWKDENKKDLDREIEADTRLNLGVMELLPAFDNLITIYEIKWNKSRNDFNVIERDLVIKEFHKLYGKKVNKLLMGEK